MIFNQTISSISPDIPTIFDNQSSFFSWTTVFPWLPRWYESLVFFPSTALIIFCLFLWLCALKAKVIPHNGKRHKLVSYKKGARIKLHSIPAKQMAMVS
jgi:hypothetical protein